MTNFVVAVVTVCSTVFLCVVLYAVATNCVFASVSP
jgi:hypothetical protein